MDDPWIFTWMDLGPSMVVPMLDSQPLPVTLGLWQTTLQENTITAQRWTNPAVMMPEWTANTIREKPLATTQTEKGRTTRWISATTQISTSSAYIPDVETGLSWLAAKGLLALSGTTLTLASFAETLFQVRVLPNTPLQTLNGICAVAFLLQETELTSTAKEISTLVSKELAEYVTLPHLFQSDSGGFFFVYTVPLLRHSSRTHLSNLHLEYLESHWTNNKLD